MNKSLENQKMSVILVLVCFTVYTLISFSRSAYTAAIAGIIDDGIFSRTAAGTINSSFYITYSLAQILGSFFVDKVSPFKLIALALVGTILANIAMTFSASFVVIFFARSCVGIVQFGVWPALLKIITEYISTEYRAKSQLLMPLGISSGTILSFLIASIVLKYGNWQDLFVVTYVLLSLITIIFFITVFFANKKAVETIKDKVIINSVPQPQKRLRVNTLTLILSSGAIFIFITSFTNSLFTSGIASWMSTMLMESYKITPSLSSGLVTLTTCSAFLSVFVVAFLYPRYIKNAAMALGLLYLMILPLVVSMSFIGKIPLVYVIIAVMLTNILTDTLKQFFTVIIPTGYKKYNKAGMLAGQINVAACLGSMIAGTIYGYIADRFGWNATVTLWCVLILIALTSSFIAAPIWKKFINKDTM